MAKSNSNWVVALCPISKIFIDNLQVGLKKDPDKIYDEKASFKIAVPRCDGYFNMEFKKPRVVNDLMLLQYLLGDSGPDTDWTGIVRLPIDEEIVEGLAQITAMSAEDPEKAMKEANKFQKELRASRAEAMKIAKEMSYERVMKAVRQCRQMLLKQYQRNEEEKLGFYKPSNSEFLATMVLAEEESKRTADERQVTDKFRELMKQTAVM